jgi:chaperone BCS1
MMPARWGSGWQKRADLPTRGLDSVVLKAGQLERLRDDLGDFLASEERYVRMSQPWHRGYLLHGPPGTGKTSVARSLATEFGLPSYYLPLGDIAKDSDLMQLVGGIKPRSVLLLEDVDSFHAATSRTDEKDHASVATLLNALDGVWTPHGLITIMTTNNRDALDSALIRAGRIDVDEELSVLDEEQAIRLAERLLPGGLTDAVSFVGRAPSELIEHIRNNTQGG